MTTEKAGASPSPRKPTEEELKSLGRVIFRHSFAPASRKQKSTVTASSLAAKLKDGIIGGKDMPATAFLVKRIIFDEVIAALATEDAGASGSPGCRGLDGRG